MGYTCIYIGQTVQRRFVHFNQGFPRWLSGKEFASQAGDMSSIPGLERSSSGEGNGNPLQYSCLENPVDTRDYSPGDLKTVRHDLATKPQYTFYRKQTLKIIIKGWGVDGGDTDDDRVAQMLIIFLKLDGLVQVTFLDQDTIHYTLLNYSSKGHLERIRKLRNVTYGLFM